MKKVFVEDFVHKFWETDLYEDFKEYYNEFRRNVTETEYREFWDYYSRYDGQRNISEAEFKEAGQWKMAFVLVWEELLPIYCGYNCSEEVRRKEINDRLVEILQKSVENFEQYDLRILALQICVDVVCVFWDISDRIAVLAALWDMLHKLSDDIEYRKFYDNRAQKAVIQRTENILELHGVKNAKLEKMLKREKRSYVKQFMKKLLQSQEGENENQKESGVKQRILIIVLSVFMMILFVLLMKSSVTIRSLQVELLESQNKENRLEDKIGQLREEALNLRTEKMGILEENKKIQEELEKARAQAERNEVQESETQESETQTEANGTPEDKVPDAEKAFIGTSGTYQSNSSPMGVVNVDVKDESTAKITVGTQDNPNIYSEEGQIVPEYDSIILKLDGSTLILVWDREDQFTTLRMGSTGMEAVDAVIDNVKYMRTY